MSDDENDDPTLEELLADLEQKEDEIARLTNENQLLKSKSKNKVLLGCCSPLAPSGFCGFCGLCLFQLPAPSCLLKAACCCLLLAACCLLLAARYLPLAACCLLLAAFWHAACSRLLLASYSRLPLVVCFKLLAHCCPCSSSIFACFS